jgi:hypothetical protein
LTVTALDTTTTPTLVEGVRITPRAFIRLDLTPDQIAELGLPPGAYHIQGPLTDASGDLVYLPEVESLQVPVRWLYPSDAHRTDSHRDVDQQPW